jgi:hypothetical protein
MGCGPGLPESTPNSPGNGSHTIATRRALMRLQRRFKRLLYLKQERLKVGPILIGVGYSTHDGRRTAREGEFNNCL